MGQIPWFRQTAVGRPSFGVPTYSGARFSKSGGSTSAGGRYVHVADGASYTSRLRAATTDTVQGALRSGSELAWEANGNAISSCEEYVFEKYYSFAAFDRLARRRGLDPRGMFDLAFSDGDAGFARQLLGERQFIVRRRGLGRSSAGVVVRHPWPTGPRQAFWSLFEFVNEHGRPILVDPITGELMRQTREVEDTVTWDIDRHRRLEELARTATRPARLIGGSSRGAGGEQTVGYTDEELEEAWMLQQRFQRAWERFTSGLARCNGLPVAGVPLEVVERFRSRGEPYSIAEETLYTAPWYLGSWGQRTAPARSLTVLEQIALDPTAADGIDESLLRILRGGMAPPVARPTGSFAAAGGSRLRVPSLRETAASIGRFLGNPRADCPELGPLLAEIRRTTQRARDLGCFNPDVDFTPCDWSPQLFAEQVVARRNGIDVAMEEDFRACLDATANLSSFEELRNYTIVREAPSFSSGGPVSEVTCFEMGPANFLHNTLVFDLYRELSRMANIALDACALDLARTIIEQDAPQLIDANGRIRQPGFRVSGQEQLGSEDVLAAGYRYSLIAESFGFGPSGTCANAGMEFRGEAGAYVYFFSARIPIIELSATARQGCATLNAMGSCDGQGIRYSANVLGLLSLSGQAQANYNILSVPGIGFEVGEGDPSWSFRTFVTVLGIPVRLEAGFAGGIRSGDLNLGLTPVECREDLTAIPPVWPEPSYRVNASVQPELYLRAYALAALELGLARIGIKGSLELLSLGVPTSVAVLARNEGRFLMFTFEASSRFRMRTLQGQISVFGEAGICPFCVSAEVPVFQFPGRTAELPLFDYRYTVDYNALSTYFRLADMLGGGR